MNKGDKVFKIVEKWVELSNECLWDMGTRTWFVVGKSLITEKDLLYKECGTIITWKLLHTSKDYGLSEISEGIYGE